MLLVSNYPLRSFFLSIGPEASGAFCLNAPRSLARSHALKDQGRKGCPGHSEPSDRHCSAINLSRTLISTCQTDPPGQTHTMADTKMQDLAHEVVADKFGKNAVPQTADVEEMVCLHAIYCLPDPGKVMSKPSNAAAHLQRRRVRHADLSGDKQHQRRPELRSQGLEESDEPM